MEKQLCLQHMQMIESVCLELKCNKQYYLCNECIAETHQNHKLINAQEFQSLEQLIKEMTQTIFEDIEYTKQIMLDKFSLFQEQLTQYSQRQNQIEKNEFLSICQNISQKLVQIRHFLLRKENNQNIKWLWTEEEIQEIAQYLENFENKSFIEKLAEWQEKLRNQCPIDLQFEIETNQCTIGMKEFQDGSIYFGQNIDGNLQGRGIKISYDQIQDGLFKNGQFIYGLWLLQNHLGEVIQKQGNIDDSIERQMKSIILQKNYLQSWHDYDETKQINQKRFSWNDEEYKLIQQVLNQQFHQNIIAQYHQLLNLQEIPEEYHQLQFEKNNLFFKINEQQSYFGGIYENKYQGRGILIDQNGLKDGIWEKGQFLLGIWIAQFNHKMFSYQGIINEDTQIQYELFIKEQEQIIKSEEKLRNQQNHEIKLKIFKRIQFFMDSLIFNYIKNSKLKEQYKLNKLEQNIDVPDQYLQFEGEPEIIRNQQQCYIGFLDSNKYPNQIGYYCDQIQILGGYWENGLLIWGTLTIINGDKIVQKKYEIQKEIQEIIQIKFE